MRPTLNGAIREGLSEKVPFLWPQKPEGQPDREKLKERPSGKREQLV